ncbi:hypothetical protein FIA58_004010 [Flavobacterium jejuense]|uniref:Imelysin-like domain-containing protein n=1 Tax=Flavobacterium jejuense TaxID=1544455 RepID=A0ABX0ISH4_9FLAO|nr:imelysin family protein [Flavobacterium jejuense]NHN24834.1 hypothetical protein [Flavobacterium jejuense]
MKRVLFFKPLILVTTIALAFNSCQNDDDAIQRISKEEVIKNYTEIVHANYLNAYNDAVALKTAITNFTATPSQTLFNEAKMAWQTARESYGTTEAFRFIDGPIDDENGPESLLNAWPLDENFIDYVDGAPTAGIINNTATYPTLSKSLLESLNEDGGEKNISVGYHAIEFLLWGQDLTAPSANLPGQRPYTDFVDGGTGANQDRRREYLNICADLLTDHLSYLVNQWKPNATYRNYFLNLDQDVALKKIFTGAIVLVYSELAIERVNVALYNQDQEDEHSCFSDNTHRDIRLNLQGVINVYQGDYGTISGVSLENLVRESNFNLANEVNEAIVDAKQKTNATLIPFDMAIQDGPTSIEGAKVKAAVEAMQLMGSNLNAAAQSLGITID